MNWENNLSVRYGTQFTNLLKKNMLPKEEIEYRDKWMSEEKNEHYKNYRGIFFCL